MPLNHIDVLFQVNDKKFNFAENIIMLKRIDDWKRIGAKFVSEKLIIIKKLGCIKNLLI